MNSYFNKRIIPFFYLFLSMETLMRLIFLAKEWHQVDSGANVLKIVGVGFLYDLAACAYFMVPMALYLLLLPAKFHATRVDRVISGTLFGAFAYMLFFTSISEWFFWDEFTARFNFIAVDYLVYTHEVIGNIRESYPVLPILACIAVVALLLGWLYTQMPVLQRAPSLPRRMAAFAVSVLIALLSFGLMKTGLADMSANRYQNEIAKNGFYELFSAYRHNELDFKQFYASADESQLLPLLREQIDSKPSDFIDGHITHRIISDKPEQRYNVVMVTVESLSGEYLSAFGNKENLTPYLNKLANESLFFTNFYATGTRTVYGLSSLTLSIPPIPGNSIVRRPQNEHLFSLGSVFNSKGYKSKFIYGGFGYFDNMNYFFKSNGYEIVDRTNLAKDEITFANIWGVADEDLFRRTIRENDKAYAEGKPFFDMVMTTSNHRPFTYPEGKIDIPSKAGRKGGVKYTDYAIRQFIEEAKKHPWFDNTIFVIVADHTAGGAGKSELDPKAYHIPLIIYAPKLVAARKVDALSSQIDVAPTLLGLLNMDYTSRFYGKDILNDPPKRALISNYQQLGYLTEDKLLILKPISQVLEFRKSSQDFTPVETVDENLKLNALSYFQSATLWREWNKEIPGAAGAHADAR